MRDTATAVPAPCARCARQRIIEEIRRRIGETSDARHGTPAAASGVHVTSDDLGTGHAYFDHDDLGLSLRIGRVDGF